MIVCNIFCVHYSILTPLLVFTNIKRYNLKNCLIKKEIQIDMHYYATYFLAKKDNIPNKIVEKFDYAIQYEDDSDIILFC